MAEKTEISWCDHTWNPWVGCAKVSIACDFCYAEEWAKRYRPDAALWAGNRARTSASNWAEPFKWDRQAKAAGVRRRVFCASLADWLDNKAPDQWRSDLAEVIEETPNLDWLLLTKRPQNFGKHAPWNDEGDIPPNVWLGITAENQAEYDRRWPHLSAITRRHKLFVSYEPALGPLNVLDGYVDNFPDWVICGGESGASARPMHPDWARSIRGQCQIAGIYFHFKQWGQWLPGDQAAEHHQARAVKHRAATGDEPMSFGLVGKKAAGRLLDGVEHNEFPGAA